MKKRPDGRYATTITYIEDGKRKKMQIYAKTQKELSLKKDEARAKMQKGFAPVESKKTFGEFSDYWIANCKPLIEPATMKGYVNALKTHLNPYFNDFNLRDIKEYTINDFIAKKVKQGCKTATLEKIKITLYQILKEAHKREYIYSVPALVKIPKMEKKKKLGISIFERNLILDYWKEHRSGIFFLTLLCTGIRKGEAIALKWSNIDFKNNLIHIKNSASLIDNQPIDKSTKTLSSIRDIPLVEPLASALKEMKKNSIYVFTSANNKQLSETAYRRMFDSFLHFISEKSNTVVEFTAHQLRHTYSTVLFESGIMPKTAQSWLGHSDFSTTMDIYTHLSDELSKEESLKLSFEGKTSSQKVVKTS